jgi:hypothetical protein
MNQRLIIFGFKLPDIYYKNLKTENDFVNIIQHFKEKYSSLTLFKSKKFKYNDNPNITSNKLFLGFKLFELNSDLTDFYDINYVEESIKEAKYDISKNRKNEIKQVNAIYESFYDKKNESILYENNKPYLTTVLI